MFCVWCNTTVGNIYCFVVPYNDRIVIFLCAVDNVVDTAEDWGGQQDRERGEKCCSMHAYNLLLVHITSLVSHPHLTSPLLLPYTSALTQYDESLVASATSKAQKGK